MLRFVFLLIFCLALSLGADHDIFKDCTRVEFCTRLRNKAPEEKYTIDVASLIQGSSSVSFQLTPNDDSPMLKLDINILENDVIRVKIAEVNSSRYQLEHVLDGEPTPRIIDAFSPDEGHYTAIIGDITVELSYSPFFLEIYKDNEVRLRVDGSSLVVETTDASKAFAFEAAFPQAVQFYGIHEHADSLALRNTSGGTGDPYRLRNLDVPGYELNSGMALYGAIPVLYAHGLTSTSGIFLHNAAEQWIDLSNGQDNTKARFMVESGTLDFFALLGPTPVDIVRQYTNLTGKAHLPQLWTLGYHQCRWNYDNQSDVKNVVANFDSNNFQMDAIWLDIEYTDGKKYFTWNPENFSDPLEMQANVSSTNRKMVTIIDPHIKVESGYAVYDFAKDMDLFVKNPDGSNFEGDCWPGKSSYMDFLNPVARFFYGSMYSYFYFVDSTETIAGIWNDMNEPSVFNDSSEKTMPGDVVHYGGVAHRDIHNIYGLLHTMATHQGLLDRDQGTKRPFVLTRSHFAGTQRYSAIWTGDNLAQWGYLQASYSECLNANVLGIVFCGADVGGFDGNPDEELFQRWYQAGAWLPFFRAHANMGTERREPYLFPPPVQEVIRNAIQTRYAHIPTWYTLFYEHTRTGDPVIRPLFYHYPSDPNAVTIDNQLLVGRDILIRPVTEAGATSINVYFPGGTELTWMSIDNLLTYAGGYYDIPVTMNTIGTFYRSGGIITRKDIIRRTTTDALGDPYSLYAVYDANNRSQGTAYVDDFTSFNYRDKSQYLYLNIEIENDEVSYSYIDDNADPLDFDFTVLNIYIFATVQPAELGKPGKYQMHHYTKDANGTPLKDLKLNFNEQKKATFRLK